MDFLASHLQKNAQEAGYGSFAWVGKSMIYTILFENEVRPHRIAYYLEKRDPDCDRKKKLVFSMYQKVPLLGKSGR
jgi:hypothetical protein